MTAQAQHFIFESLGYVVAFRLYIHSRNTAGDLLDDNARLRIIVAAAVGAAIGSKLLHLFEDPVQTLRHWNDLGYLLSGKTVVGALLGGTIAVEYAKRRTGMRQRTGDLFAVPLAVGIAIGRIGCFLAGAQDDTFGTPTSAPWAVDLGDGVRRHPVQLYETAAMIMLAILLIRIRPPRFEEGDRYRAFVFAYFSWRFFIDFFKPAPRFANLSMLQWACAVAALWYAKDVWRMLHAPSIRPEAVVHG
jgi:phosphatidylglycerol:prolipoprotein diacylglycerol transferase